jgi:hypothetical protein
MLDRTTSTPTDELLSRINAAVAVCNDAEKKAEGAKAEYVSRGRAVGVLLLELKQHYPKKPQEFEAKLTEISGLHRTRAYEFMALAGGRKTEAELREEARFRKERERQRKAAEKRERERAEKAKPKPAPESVTSRTEAQQVFDSPEAAHSNPKPTSSAIRLDYALTNAWRLVVESAAAGKKSVLRSSLTSLRTAALELLKSEVLK